MITSSKFGDYLDDRFVKKMPLTDIEKPWKLLVKFNLENPQFNKLENRLFIVRPALITLVKSKSSPQEISDGI